MSVDLEVDGPIATIVIRGRNDLNPFSPEMALELHRQLMAFEADPALRVAIIRGAGDRAFSVGGDLKRAQELSDQLFDPRGLTRHFWDPLGQETPSPVVAWSTLYYRRVAKPVLAAVKGYCLGAALIVLGVHTDIRIASRSARFGMPELARGVGAGVAAGARLGEQVPHAALMWLVQTGEVVGADRARDMHLVNEVVPDELVFTRASEVASAIASLAPEAVRREKLALIRGDLPSQ
jgi:enoyl-CoA hydratase/carnithine racemase